MSKKKSILFVIIMLLTYMISTTLHVPNDYTNISYAKTMTWKKLASSNYYGAEACVVINNKIYTLTVVNGNQVKLEMYDPKKNKWSVQNSPVVRRIGFFTVIVNDGLLYLLGGAIDNNLTATNSVEVYNPSSGKWVTKAAMLNSRIGKSFAVSVKNKIYTVANNQIEVYDPSDDTWSVAYQGLMERERYGIVALKDKIYIVGGTNPDSSKAYTEVEEFNTITGKLSKKASLVSAVAYPYLAVVKNKIYLLLGTDKSGVTCIRNIQVYDPDNNKWKTKSKIPFTRVDIQIALANNKFYMTGGWDDGTFAADVNEYNPLTDKWKIIPSLPTARNYHCVAGIKNSIYVFGGKSDYNTGLNTAYTLNIN